MRRLVLASLLLTTATCGGGDPSLSAPPLTPTLSSIQTLIFSPSCATSGCHNPTSNRGNLSLIPGQSRAQLVNVAADDPVARARGKLRVVPGDPDGSFLVQKIQASLRSPDEGDAMPRLRAPLSQEKIDAIRSWIQRGAPDD